MSFKHDLLPDVQLEQINDPEGRYYLLNGNRYISCTTLVGKMLELVKQDKSGLDNWKKRVGEKEAQQIRDRAAAKGTALHLICENYLLNRTDYRKNVMPHTMASFLSVKPFLDRYIQTIYGIEHRAYSDKFHCAGTIDLICKCNGKKTILDFKTARKLKEKKHIIQYLFQATLYKNMVEETHDFPIEQIVILVAVENEKEPQKFIFKSNQYQEALEKVYAKYRASQV